MTFPLKIVGILKKVPTPTDGLIAYYPFNGNANDESGNGNNGTVNGAVLATGRKGGANHAYEFTKGEDDYISIDGVGHLAYISISLWGKVISGSNMGWVSKGQGSTQGDYSMKSSTNIAVTTNGTINIQGNATLTDWNHVVYTYDGANARLYINSVLVDTSTSIASLDNNFSSIRLGQYYNSGFSLNGYLDDARIYNRALDQDEIDLLFAE